MLTQCTRLKGRDIVYILEIFSLRNIFGHTTYMIAIPATKDLSLRATMMILLDEML